MNNLKLTLLFISLSINVFAYQEHKWDKVPERVEIPMEFQNEDAVIVEREFRFAINMFNLYEYGIYQTKSWRTRILTKEGIAASRILIPKNPFSKISVLDARTIKANGQVIDMKSSDIKELDINFDEKDVKRNEKFYLFSVPGVEVGDEIEVIYVIEDAPIPYKVFLHDEFAVLNSSYTLTIPKIALYEVYNANGMVKPEIKSIEGNKVRCRWNMTNLPALGEADYSIKSLEVPHVVQVIRGINLINIFGIPDQVGWPDYFVEFEKYVDNEDRYVSKKYGNAVDNFINELWKGHENEGIAAKLKIVHDYLNQNMDIVNVDSKEAKKPLGYFLEIKKIEQFRLLTLYAQIFKKANIPYDMAFARNKYNGVLNPNIVHMVQVDYMFFTFTDENKKLHYLFPKSDEEQYEMDELPTYLQGTLAILIYSDNKIGRGHILPSHATEDISQARKIESKVNLNEKTITHDFQETLSGAYSTDLRFNYVNAARGNKMEEYFNNLCRQRNESMILKSVSIDSFSNVYPYHFRLKYQVDMTDQITKLDDDLYSISIENWFWHDHIKIDKDKRWLTYFPDYPHNDSFKYYLVFDEDVELVNAENLNHRVVHQQIGAYLANAKQISPKIILLESKYLLGGAEVEKSNIPNLSEIYEAMERGDNEPIMVRVKK